MSKLKSHKGLLKRIRITKSGKVKFHRAGGRHLKSVKSGSRVRQYRRPAYATSADMNRLRSLLHVRVQPADAEVQPKPAPERGETTVAKKGETKGKKKKSAKK